MNHLMCNAGPNNVFVIWAPVSFSLSFSSFIILANCFALSFYSNDVTMTMKTGSPSTHLK